MGDGPEQAFADITSGQPAALDAVIEACSTTMRHLADAIDLIGFATDKPEWDSSMDYEVYNQRAWATRAAAEVAFIRVNRTSLAVTMAANAYAAAVDSATDVIEWWRTTKRSDVSGDVLSLARAIASLQLYTVRIALNGRLAEATDFLRADPLTDDQEKWHTTGLIKSMLHDLNSPNDRGPIIPNTLATGDDDGGWTPQGLGYDPDGHPPALLQTSYSGGKAQLARIDPETGEQLGFVNLGGTNDQGPPDHAGGVTVHGDRVDVMSSGKPAQMYTYSLQAIRDASPGETVSMMDSRSVAAGAYSTIDGDTLYVGTFTKDDPGELFTYKWDPARERWVDQPGSFFTPPQTQGAAVVDGQIVFSTSHGRGSTSELHAYQLSDVLNGHGNDENYRLGGVGLPTMSEGVVALDGRGLFTTFESGAAPYSLPKGDVSLDDLWASQAMSVTPYAALGMAGGIAVVPVTLERAAVDFADGGRRLQIATASIDTVSLPSGCLGKNAQGNTFATAVTSHCNDTSQWISEGRISADVTADGLLTSAKSYVQVDQMIRDLFETLTSRTKGS
ncbi:hypothetical protein [Aeromicrobium chenweiae]|uniref:Uncharacterized protein n=1 Tax=Aeromicrobium chenweiae TaxID=2079793 RepID=A0A2S0WNX7_9ACTN|nr:hypothetical protein [Aeromicrobium chenweiae]AWB93017.1 hypothetical protein C3E78_12825 [Aeromicrobium chenweiae]TGN34007.1 hypothetical protein E4L97_02865 [Aeromicrobium chenweiae]